MSGIMKLPLNFYVFFAIAGLWGCGTGVDQVVGPAKPVDPKLHAALTELTNSDSPAAMQKAVEDVVQIGDYRAAAFLKSFREGQSIYKWKDRLVLVQGFHEGPGGVDVAKLFDSVLRTEY